MKIRNYLYIAIVISVVLISCRDTDAPKIDIPFTVSNENPTVGDTLTFTFGAGADGLAIYQGEPSNNNPLDSRNVIVTTSLLGSEFAKSALYNLRKDDNKTQYILTDSRYGTYTLDSKAETANPPSLAASGLAKLAPKQDSLVRFDITGTGDNNEILIKPDIALYPKSNDPVLSNVTLNRNLNMVIALAGGTPGTLVALRFSLKIDGVYTNAAITTNPAGRVDATITIPTRPDTLITIAPNMTALLDHWRANNPTKVYGKIEEIKMQVGVVTPTTPTRFTGTFGIRSITLGSPIYDPWDLGTLVKYTAPNTPATYKFRYQKAGTYTATMVATKVGRKKFGPDGYIYDRAEQLNEDEYNISRQVKQIQIVVKP